MCDTSSTAPATATSHSLDSIAASVVAADVAPSAAVGWGALLPDGSLRIEVGGAWARRFDLASVTKSLTAVAVLRAGLAPTSQLASYLPELAETAAAAARIEHLLAHRAGLRGHLELFEPLRRGSPFDAAAALRIAADARRPECTGAIPLDGFDALYSDMGYLLAGTALARFTGAVDAGAAVERFVVAPLGLEDQLGSARALGPTADYVPTETVPWRDPQPLRGIVHDENALAFTGHGASGHAGMFGTAPALVRFGLEVLRLLEGKGPLASAQDPSWLVAARPGTTWRAGFDGKSASGSSAGASASMRSFGHLGFTGTSFWIDPERRVVSVLLCNRVAPSRDRVPVSGGIKVVRPLVHDALFRDADARLA